MIKQFIKAKAPLPLLKIILKIYFWVKYRKTPQFNTPINNEVPALSCLIAYNNYGGYCIPISSLHRPASQATLRGEIWEKDTIDFINSNSGNGDVIHAGTYFGDFLPALSRGSSSSTVWAFEPNLENFKCANITKQINNLENIKLTNAGLGETKGSVLMMTKDKKGKSMGGSSTIIDNNDLSVPGYTETVKIISIDEFIPKSRNISVIQLDVEGYEKQALTGALKTIQRCLPILIIEILPDLDWFKNNILSLGYNIEGEVQGNTIINPK